MYDIVHGIVTFEKGNIFTCHAVVCISKMLLVLQICSCDSFGLSESLGTMFLRQCARLIITILYKQDICLTL